MFQRHNLQQLLPGLIITACILALIVTVLLQLINQASGVSGDRIWQDTYLAHVIQFTFLQASISTLFSVLLAIPVAYALYQRHFIGKNFFLKLCSLTLVLPVLIGVIGLLAIYGNHGFINKAIGYCGFDNFSIYGITGIVLAHIFFNMPLAILLFLKVFNGIPYQQHLLSAHLGLYGWNKFVKVAWPAILQQLPHVMGLIFMLCFTSFTIVMSLGGGPQSTTIEVAIYQAIRYDFDFINGAQLAVCQMIICCGLVFICHRFMNTPSLEINFHHKQWLSHQDSWLLRCWDSMWICFAVCVVIPPFFAIFISGINRQFFTVIFDQALWLAVGRSLSIALIASFLAFFSSIALLCSSRCLRMAHRCLSADGIETVGMVILVLPSVVLSTGLFLIIHQYDYGFNAILWLIASINALMALPYTLKILSQPMWQIAKQYNQLCITLGLKGLSRLRWVEWEMLRQPAIQALSFGFILSLGDLTAIALLGNHEFQTLPMYLFNLMSNYQLDASAVIALLLLLLCLLIFMLINALLNGKYNQGVTHVKD